MRKWIQISRSVIGSVASSMDESNASNQIAGDFLAVLKRQRVITDVPSVTAARPDFTETVATTILGFKFAGGVLVAGDRRATAGNVVMYDRADKVLEIDRHSVMAIAGSPATAWEMARILEHSFKFYRRSQLQEMSVEGKVRALSKLLRDNLGMVIQGVGVVVPLFATYEKRVQTRLNSFFTTRWAPSLRRPILRRAGRARQRSEACSIMNKAGARNRCGSVAKRPQSCWRSRHSTRLPKRTPRPAESIDTEKYFQS